MDQVLPVIGVVAAVWLAVSVVVALGFGRVVRIAETRERGRRAYADAVRPVPARVR